MDSHMVVFDPPDDPEATDFYYKGIRQQNCKGLIHVDEGIEDGLVWLYMDCVFVYSSTRKEA